MLPNAFNGVGPNMFGQGALRDLAHGGIPTRAQFLDGRDGLGDVFLKVGRCREKQGEDQYLLATPIHAQARCFLKIGPTSLQECQVNTSHKRVCEKGCTSGLHLLKGTGP